MNICERCSLDRDMAAKSLIETMGRGEPPDQMVAFLVDQCSPCSEYVGRKLAVHTAPKAVSRV